MANFYYSKAEFTDGVFETIYEEPLSITITPNKTQQILAMSYNVINGVPTEKWVKWLPFDLTYEEIGQLYGGN